MPRVKIDYIASFSSEDPDNPASNLLSWDINKKKWLCSKGEISCSIVLQLTQSVKICSVTIGAHQAALVEVLVGRSEAPNEPFQVLVPRSILQTPAEARRGGAGDADKVRSFAGAALAPAATLRWDRLRVLADQPYNKHTQFGLSFVHVFSEEAPPPAPPEAAPPAPPSPPAAAPPALQSSDEEEFRPGELFAQHRSPAAHADTGGQIRQATSHALKNIPDSSIKLNKAPLARGAGRGGQTPPARGGAAPPTPPAGGDRRRAGLLYSADDERPNARVDRVLQRHHAANKPAAAEPDNKPAAAESDIKPAAPPQVAATAAAAGAAIKRHEDSKKKMELGKTKHNTSNTSRADTSRADTSRAGQASRKRKAGLDPRQQGSSSGSTLAAGPVSRAPHALLADVVLVLSGYENPRRSQLRQAALALGAAAERDWGPRCTHLICAFPNTPKLRAVRAAPGGARAVVVRGEWVEQCARTRRRLPWQWFATEPERGAPPPPGWDAPPPDEDSEGDTDDEIERVRRKMAARPAPARSPSPRPARSPSPRPAPATVAGEASPEDDVAFVRDERLQGFVTVTDSESDSTDEERPAARRAGGGGRLPAFLRGAGVAVRAPRRRLLARYLRAYGADLLEEDHPSVQYIISSESSPRPARVPLLAPRWLWRCHAARRLLPPGDAALADS